jgi:hypothetical protein
MRLPLNVVLFPGRRVRNAPRPLTRAERIEDAVTSALAIGISLAIWALVGYALWQLVASAFLTTVICAFSCGIGRGASAIRSNLACSGASAILGMRFSSHASNPYL